MSGQMKTMLDRANPLYTADYTYRDVYLLATAADEDEHAIDGARKGLEGFIACLKGHVLRVVSLQAVWTLRVQ